MHLIYLDDSRDEHTVVFSALAIPSNNWREAFERLKTFRARLKTDYGIYIREELHAWKFISGRGNISDRIVTKYERSQIFRETLEVAAQLPSALLFNAVFPARRINHAYERLLNRINRTMQTFDSHALLICDEGNEHEYSRIARRMHVFNPIPSMFGTWEDGSTARNIPIERIVEDPFYKISSKSFFIQLVDFCAFSLLRRERPVDRQMRYNIHTAFNILNPILFLNANYRDPEGIIRP